jgi:hypothetical protein
MSTGKLRIYPLIVAMGMAIVVLLGCAKNGKDDEEIRSAINARLATQSSLNTGAFDTDIQKIVVNGNQATADVAFKLKGGPGSMQLTYNLAKNGGKWSVVESNPITFSHSGPDANGNGAPAGAGAPPSDVIDAIHGKLGATGH